MWVSDRGPSSAQDGQAELHWRPWKDLGVLPPASAARGIPPARQGKRAYQSGFRALKARRFKDHPAQPTFLTRKISVTPRERWRLPQNQPAFGSARVTQGGLPAG
ncbi:hypothetical protein NDU88_004551 [Pleurodeles waltl]|uniref:Uncharacterized protein n=1 Tax=Pleurodeles waltl TaxID=8319 RepID=A0AAV7N1S2_PLEWA|nr:hypothetical protein NDU88_004551 [Pleurodeles waltl]